MELEGTAARGLRREVSEEENTERVTSGIIPMRRGEMAEWLKAAVC